MRCAVMYCSYWINLLLQLGDDDIDGINCGVPGSTAAVSIGTVESHV